jgi:hypothetical protein
MARLQDRGQAALLELQLEVGLAWLSAGWPVVHVTGRKMVVVRFEVVENLLGVPLVVWCQGGWDSSWGCVWVLASVRPSTLRWALPTVARHSVPTSLACEKEWP